MEPRKKDGPLLELIPKGQLSARQKALLPAKYRGRLPMHRWLREPTHLDDIDWESYGNVAIWFDNGTIMCLYRAGTFHEEHSACFMISHVDDLDKYFLECVIHGETEASIVETVAFLWTLKQYQESKTHLTISEFSVDGVGYTFDFATLQPEQLARMLDANPTRRFFFQTGVWNAERSLVLATRPNAVDLHLTEAGWDDGISFAFEDEGTVFVDALENRKSAFGSLSIDYHGDSIPFSRANFQRLLQLEIFEKLQTGILSKKFALLPFSTKAKALVYTISPDTIQPKDFNSLDIVTKDLHLKVYLGRAGNNWDALSIAFLNRMAVLGHFERFCFLISGRRRFEASKVARVAEALIRAISANPKLTYLNLGDFTYDDPKDCVNWSPHLQNLFKAMEVHKGLRTVVVGRYPREDSFYVWLEQLLSCNRDITVLDRSGNRISNGVSIDNLYALNHFYKGSAELVKESMNVRSWLAGTALVERKLQNFQYTALLFSHHTDMVCDLIQDDAMNDEDSVASQAVQEETELPASIPRDTKRMRT